MRFLISPLAASAPAVLLAAVLAGAAPAAAADMNPGLWEITARMEMEGMPVPMPAHTYTQCIREERPVPGGGDGRDDACTMKEMKVRGDTVTWTMVCPDQGDGPTRTTGRITYKGDRFEGNVEMSEGGRVMMRQRLSGRRIGPCP
ncbi:DUF3617 family protein [Dissulfurirhabdus thermomarina]|uniref:DUF3617 family protein n=1 Tax=Dissulfurirhabdus thermomarina TaxID=1765737 RepID=A0A6N9TR82_DISTH|nr:DUF3617 family protein [Dissulfurirhabdus thermomarina]NDY42613.1 DUF3617 family protein [Dissulfurirhabdus thermomarina]NMX24070.1 DUF3617 family protein [Dissulfurirhabdus thermomarina]